MMRGFLQIAFAILSSTRRPIASCVCAAQRSSRRPLLELAIDSKRSATASGLTRLFSMLRDLTFEFSSRTAHSVDTARSLRSQLQAENLTHLSLFLSALKMSQKSCSEMPQMLFRLTSFNSPSFFCSFSSTSSGFTSFGGSGSKYWSGSAYASITKSCGLVLRMSANSMMSFIVALERASSISGSSRTCPSSSFSWAASWASLYTGTYTFPRFAPGSNFTFSSLSGVFKATSLMWLIKESLLREGVRAGVQRGPAGRPGEGGRGAGATRPRDGGGPLQPHHEGHHGVGRHSQHQPTGLCDGSLC